MSTQGPSDILSRIGNRWISPQMQRDPETCRRARITVGTALTSCVMDVIFGLVYALSGEGPGGWALATVAWCGAPIFAACLPILRRSRALWPTAAVILVTALVELSALSWIMGGILAPSLIWFVLVPCLLLLISGRRAAVGSLAVCLSLYVGFLWLHPIPAMVSESFLHWFWFPCTLGFMVYAFLLFVIYERTKDGAVAMLREKGHILAHARREAHVSNRSKGAFLSRMSHEIRTPLMAILGFTDLLAEQVQEHGTPAPAGEGVGEDREVLRTLRRNGEYLLHIINDLLDLSRIESDTLRIERRPVPLRPLLDDVLSLLRPSAEARGIAVRLEAASDLPITLDTDATRMRQILVNLLANALKFTEQGSVTLRVVQIGEGAEARVSLAVSDTGIGMTPEQLERIFQPFGQAAPETARLFGGSGLGLVISKRLIDALGGRVRVESRVGRGTTFTIEHPVGRETESATCELTAPGDPSTRELPLRNQRILVVDDFPDNRVLISRLLSRAGATVEIAVSGAAALESVEAADRESRPFDCIVMDVQMPGMDGCEATVRLRSSGCRTPIAALTADALESTRQRCQRAGFDGYATKPISRVRLLELVRETREGVAPPMTPEVPPRVETSDEPLSPTRPGLWSRLVASCVAPSVRDDRETLRRASMVLGFALSPLPFVAAGVWVLPRLYAPEVARTLVASFLLLVPLCVGVVVMLRRRGAVGWAGGVVNAYMLAMMTGVSLIAGGAQSCLSSWLVLLPIWAHPISGRYAARVWAVLSVGAFCMLQGIELLGMLPPMQVRAEQMPLARFVSTTSLSCILLMLGLLHENAKTESMDRIALLNAELARARDLADGSRRAKERFLVTVSHEMRTPMTAILGFAELLRDEWLRHPPGFPDAFELLKRIEHNGSRLLLLLDDVLDLSRIEAGGLELERVAVRPARVLEEVLGPARAHARSRGLRLRVRIDPGLPETIESDPLRLRQFLSKLLEGAIDSAGKGGVTLRVGTVRPASGPELWVSIEREPDEEADSGEPWPTRWNEPDESGGLLSLTLGRALCTFMGARVRLRDDVDSCAAIDVRLPVRVVGAGASERVHSRAGGPDTQSTGSIRGFHVLLAEDSPDSQRLIAHVLRQAGARVEVAADGRRVLDVVRGSLERPEDAFDVVLMDVHMPVLDGARATRMLRQEGYTGAIVALTAEPRAAARDRCLALGCDDVAEKPIDRDALLASIVAAVETAATRRRLTTTPC